MTTTYTASSRFAVATTGDPAIKDQWGTPLTSANFILIDAAINGTSAINVTGQTTISLSVANGASDQARELVQQYFGGLSGTCTATLPNIPKIGYAQNITTGGFNIILTAGPGTTATIPPDGNWHLYATDGATNVTLPIVLYGPPASTVGAASFSSGTFSGNVSMQALTATSGGFTGNVSMGNLTAAAGSFSGNVGMQALTATQATINGPVSAGALTATSGGFGNVAMNNLTASSGFFIGAVVVADLESSGPGNFAGPVSMANLTASTGTFGANVSAPNYSLPVGGKLFCASNNCSFSATSNGAVIQMSGSGNAVFDFLDAQQKYAWGYGAATPMILTGASGNLAISGALSQGSDRRIKRRIKAIHPKRGLEWLIGARPVEYDISGQPTAGFIAQDEIAHGFDRGIHLHPNPAMRASKNSPAGQQYVLDLESRVAYLTAALQAVEKRLKALERGP